MRRGAGFLLGAQALLTIALAAMAMGCGSSSNGGGGAPDAGPDVGTVDDFVTGLKSNVSCSLTCSATCAEAQTPWTCPALAPWNALPHDTLCGTWNGASAPPATVGKCSATDPTGDALAKASATPPVVLPDGRRVAPAGTEWVFDEPDLPGGFPASALLVPGTRWLVVLDMGYDTNALRVVDTTMLRAGGPSTPVVSTVKWSPPNGLNYGLAYDPTASVVYASGDESESRILAFDLSTTSGQLTQDDTKAVALPAGTLAQGLALSADGKTLAVTQAKGSTVLLCKAGSSCATPAGTIDVGGQDALALAFDPFDSTGATAYTTMWTTSVTPNDSSMMRLERLDVVGMKASTIAVGQAPESIAFLDARYAVVANALTDTLSIVDRPAAMSVGSVPISELGQQYGAGPSVVAFDPAPRSRLYVTLSSLNGVAVFDVDLTASPPALNRAGIIPTSWWPTALVVDPADGTLYVVTGKGHGSGTNSVPPANFSDGDVAELIRGSVQAVPFTASNSFGPMTATFTAQNQVSQIAGYSTVQCNGAPYDFPVPADDMSGPSAQITHVFFVVRENKTFDDIFGDVPGLDGDASLVMAPGRMDEIWPNTRAIGEEFAHLDNYYSDAEQSIQGHTWTVMGRSTDYAERRWLDIWGRAEFSVTATPGVGGNTTPVEGNLFNWLMAAGIPFDNMGELLGLGFMDKSWPGGSTDSTIPDTKGACYIAARARVLCDDKPFSYVWLTNDHTFGNDPGKPNPALMIATNDEATGMIVDGISHSPLWPSSLVVVIEDDPNTGSDHVDLHRSIALFASPWVKRKYVSNAHYDVASLHKLFANLFGKPYLNASVADAAVPLDVFTSTPDYTPYEYKPRAFQDLSCNPPSSMAAAHHWDFSLPDNQPGLAQEVWKALRSLPPRQR